MESETSEVARREATCQRKKAKKGRPETHEGSAGEALNAHEDCIPRMGHKEV